MKDLKKSLGQNFFNNPTLADKIVNLVIDTKPERILEIGPGDGYFTKRLIQYDIPLILIEKDSELYQNLKIKFPKVEIINNDFLELDFSNINLTNSTTAFGSLPYNVSKIIIKRLLEETNISNMYFIVQKEVAQKYASTIESSIIGVITKHFADTKIIQYINPGSFIPAPKVDSALIKMERNNNSIGVDTRKFINLVKQAFRSPRKTLRNNLKGLSFNKPSEDTLNKRPSQLSYSDYITLLNCLK